MRNYYFLICGLWCAMGFAQHSEETALDANGVFRMVTQNPESTTETTTTANETFTDVRELSEINIEDGQGYPWISGDGLRLYYTINTNTGSQIVYTERPDFDSPFTTPVAVMPNLPITPISVWISNDELAAYVCNAPGNVYYLQRNSVSEVFNTPILLTVSGWSASFFSGLSLSPDQNEMYAFVTPNNVDTIYRFVRTGATTFANTGILTFAADMKVSPGQLSKDGLHYIASTGTTPTGRTLKLLSRESINDAFDGTTAELIGGINAVALSDSQASVSNNMEWVAFIRNTDGTWITNRLYIARNATLSVSGAPAEHREIVMYPNPSNGVIHFNWNAKTDATLEVFNNLGQSILRQPMSNDVDLTRYEAGIYFAKISWSGFSETEKIILK